LAIGLRTPGSQVGLIFSLFARRLTGISRSREFEVTPGGTQNPPPGCCFVAK
jgi:hypothetical protein